MVRVFSMWALALCAITAPTWGRYGGGTGQTDDPYRIDTPEHLRQLSDTEADWNKVFLLTNDIVLDPGEPFPPIGIDEYGRRFSGVFDGGGHAIRGLALLTGAGRDIGLFAAVSGTIKHVRLVDVRVDAPEAEWVGALVGRLRRGTLIDCTIEGGQVAGRNNVGGLVGWTDHANLYHCSASCAVFGHNDVGGLLGDAEVTKLVGCFATGDVVATGNNIGGLVGSNYGGLISMVHAHGRVVGRFYVGGLLGGNYLGFVGDAYAVGPVDGQERVGGLVGDNAPWGVIVNAFSAGPVSGIENVGGLVGTNNNACHGSTPYGTIVGCYWDIQTSGLANMCGDVHRDCNDAVGRTTAELQRRATFQNWDFLATWTISENQTYPYFRTELAGDLNGDRHVDLCDLSIISAQWLQTPPPPTFP